MFLRQRPCERSRSLLSAHIDWRLTEEEERELQAHLDTCPACREERRTLRATVGFLREMPSVPLPRSFIIESPAPAASRLPSWYYHLRTATGAVAALLMALLAFHYLLQASLLPSMAGDGSRQVVSAPADAESSGRGMMKPATEESKATDMATAASAPAQTAAKPEAPRVAAPAAAPAAPLAADAVRTPATPVPAPPPGGAFAGGAVDPTAAAASRAAPAAPPPALPPAPSAGSEVRPAPPTGSAVAQPAAAESSPSAATQPAPTASIDPLLPKATAGVPSTPLPAAQVSPLLPQDQTTQRAEVKPEASPSSAPPLPLREIEWGLGGLLVALLVAMAIVRIRR